ncbi:MAG: hypothetical protein V3W04_03045 [Gammaproteobacteria bacterium]
MQKLTIMLTGSIQSSNFEDWKKELIAQLKTINTSLTSDSEFAVASDNVKQIKAAEKALKKAKQSAIDQAADIQKLFAAIDEVSAEARQARLSLEKQIKKRKKEIKAAVRLRGVEQIKTLIAEQSDDFQLIDHTSFLDSEQFSEALKRRATMSTLDKSMDELCDHITEAIARKNTDVKSNATAIHALPVAHQALFQDRGMLLDMQPAALNALIDDRISVFDQSAARVAAAAPEGAAEPAVPATPTSTDKTETGVENDPADELNIDFDMQATSEVNAQSERFEIVVKLDTSPDYAESLLSTLQKSLVADDAVISVRLMKVRL